MARQLKPANPVQIFIRFVQDFEKLDPAGQQTLSELLVNCREPDLLGIPGHGMVILTGIIDRHDEARRHRSRTEDDPQRSDAIVADYLAGMSRGKLASKYSMKEGQIRGVLRRRKAKRC